MSDIQEGRCLTWKVSLPKHCNNPVWKDTSPEFKLQNFKCHLLFTCTIFSNGIKAFILFLHLPQEIDFLLPFTVACFAEVREAEAFGLTFTKFQSSTPSSVREIWMSTYDSIIMYKSDFFSRDHSFNFVFTFTGAGFTTAQDPKTAVVPSLDELASDFGKLLVSGEASDAELKCGDVTRSVHRSVLSARSPVFSAMFRNKMKESIFGQVDIGNVDPGLLDIFLQYLYTGKIPEDCPEEIYPDLYALGDKYAVHSLKRQCFNWMMNRLTQDNCPMLLALVDRHGDEEFKDRLIEFITFHPEWLNSESWNAFSREHANLAVEVYQKFKVFKME